MCEEDLVPTDLSLQNKLEEANNAKTELLDETHKLNNKFIQLQSHVCITENVNNRLLGIEHLCWENAQYSRSECLNIIGIPSEVKD